MDLNTYLLKLKNTPDTITFSETMGVIEAQYDFVPTGFKNGDLMNEAGQNSGSCKIFSFAHIQELTPQQTLACFGAYYRDDVLQHPDASDHQNIRNFMRYGWQGIKFDGIALKQK